ncbi:pilus assembly protein TadG-related protein [Nocardioides KLBMP 9356]|uniref:Pilus assembly protein TadG-related protein n=1 Tax=Nocardioides potassii TaxID=2911371 RepID=A0ABS9H7T2_9ACTN|nr:pilus assembly protein TadG-related protein [Nocardioides potassii]MCF6377282.1 pilus assembly protein TadG-related protein [Nocardioides potassii]
MIPVRAARPRDDRGATAVLVGILSVFLIGLSAFTVDLGAAYVSNRNLQKAADAGALAAAQSLTKVPGTCNAVLSNSVEVGKAHALAISVAKKNYPSSTWAEDGTWKVACDPKLKVVTVQFGNKGTTDAGFAGVFGGAKKVTTSRTAEATIDVAPGAGESVRPLALCSAAIGNSVPGQFVQIFYPLNGTKSPPQCPKPKSAGNWWTLDCPEERGGATTTLEAQIKDGCKNRVTVIPGQADVNTPGALTVVLEAACPTAPQGSETCMSGDPGSLDAGHIADSWKYLVDQQKVSIFPVFCVTPQCSDDTTSGSGTNTVFPVYKLLGAVVCGYHFSNQEKYHSSTGECAGNPYLAGSDTNGNNENNYIVLKYVSVRTSGSNAESECALGATCDGGLRRTRLTQ